MDEAERQIRDYYPNADKNFQIVEGIISPIRIPLKKKKDDITVRFHAVQANVLYTYHVSAKGFIYGERMYRTSYAKYQSWLKSLDDAGVTTFFTMNHIQTARLLVIHYNNAQKEEHSTLQRLIKPKVQIKSHDPLVKSLVHLSAALGLKIGETKAQAIRDAGYTSIKELTGLKAKDLYEIEGIGRVLAKRLVDSLGGNYD
jgi:ERCC4-type nuclease